MKVKFANRIYDVLYTKELAGCIMYAVEDEPNHIDWLVNVEVVDDAEKKELKKIGQNHAEWNISDFRTWQYIVSDVLTKKDGIGQYIDSGECKKIAKYMQEEWSKKLSVEQTSKELIKGEDYGIDGLYHAISILEKTLGEVEGYQSDDGILEHECAISAVKKLYEQKPAWSEEDEKMLDIITYKMSQHQPDIFTGEENEWFDNWLKSLRPQNRWKPSEEQMKALYKTAHLSNFGADSERKHLLESLYKQLKKLREE